MLEQAKRKNQAKTRQRLDEAWGTFHMFLSECLTCFKDPAYREEQEWRVIQFGRVNFRDVLKASFRTGNGRLRCTEARPNRSRISLGRKPSLIDPWAEYGPEPSWPSC